MRIERHRLVSDHSARLTHLETPNVGGALHARFIVVHYTAFASVEQAVARLMDPQAAVSAHVIIGRDGGLVQLAAFDRQAWHAGVSCFGSYESLNAHAIGIELDNHGRLELDQHGYRACCGTRVGADDVVIAEHAHGGGVAGWHRYTQHQLEAFRSLCSRLRQHYGIERLLGHDDVAPGRKWDPGPAFPMGALRAALEL
jgi:N-acetylmuramoyl-L-alanine amidase